MNLCELFTSEGCQIGRIGCSVDKQRRDQIDQQTDQKETGLNMTALSSAVAADGYEVQGVFNEKGFMAERFVKVTAYLPIL